MRKRIVMIIAKDGFRDEELLQPKAVLEKAGVEIVIASSSKGTATGKLGASVQVDKTIDEIDASGFDAVVFVGGPGSTEYWENPVAHNIAKKANKEGRVVAAICIAPVTLVKAGVLSGKKATVWPSEADTLKQTGVVYTAKDVEVDGNLVTANGPTSAKKFGEAILASLK